MYLFHVIQMITDWYSSFMGVLVILFSENQNVCNRFLQNIFIHFNPLTSGDLYFRPQRNGGRYDVYAGRALAVPRGRYVRDWKLDATEERRGGFLSRFQHQYTELHSVRDTGWIEW